MKNIENKGSDWFISIVHIVKVTIIFQLDLKNKNLVDFAKIGFV